MTPYMIMEWLGVAFAGIFLVAAVALTAIAIVLFIKIARDL